MTGSISGVIGTFFSHVGLIRSVQKGRHVRSIRQCETLRSQLPVLVLLLLLDELDKTGLIY